MTARKLIVFEHESDLGNAPAHKLFERVTIGRRVDGRAMTIAEAAKSGAPPAREFADYEIRIDEAALPSGIRLNTRL
jgi:CRISPR-associated protein Csd2